jgi:flagellar basal body-associated protein FliL
MTNLLLALGLVASVVIAFAWMMKRNIDSGRAEAENEQRGAVLDAVVEHKEIENTVNALPADDARRRLQQWTRD